jgi:hypothetical protein
LISWGEKEYRSRRIATVVVAVPAGNPLPGPPGQFHRFSEVVGGGVAEFWDNQVEAEYFTGAQWSTPKAVYIAGEARDRRSADVQLQIYRTVRFTEG